MSADALMLGDTNPVRVNVTHPTAQKIADHLKAFCLTWLLSDERFAQADISLGPHTQPSDPAERVQHGYSPSMSDVSAMLRHHDEVAKELHGRIGLVGSPGKIWSATQRLKGRPERAANYGLYDPKGGSRAATPRGGRLWQPAPGLFHTTPHTDYSQILLFVRQDCIVDGIGMDLAEVAKDPILCWLISSEGVIESLRHPAVPESDEAPSTQPTPVTSPPSMPLFGRTMRRGMIGDDIAAWQAIVACKVDGVFGPNTEAKTKLWQKAHKLDPDGVVGPRTRKAAMDEIMPGAISTAPGTVLADASHMPWPLVIAAHYTWANRTTVHWIVLHSMEAPEKPTTAEAVGRWIAGRSGPAPNVSFHWGFDNDSAVASVPEEHVAYHACKANRFGIGYEHAGYARQSRSEWLDDYSESMLWLSARIAATVTCPRWHIPTDNVVDADGLKRAYENYIDKGRAVPDALRGFTTHAAVTAGLGGTHTDPGVDFPMDEYLDLVKQAA